MEQVKSPGLIVWGASVNYTGTCCSNPSTLCWDAVSITLLTLNTYSAAWSEVPHVVRPYLCELLLPFFLILEPFKNKIM